MCQTECGAFAAALWAGACDIIGSPFFHHPSRGEAVTWEVRDSVRTIIDCIPTELAAENVAREMNNAYSRGYRAAQDDIKAALGCR